VPEQVESTQEAFEAGATLVHVHVRDEHEAPSSDDWRFAAFKKGVERFCPGMIIQFSTGGRGREPSMRGSSLLHRPDMASLSTGSVNFPTIVYENHPSLYERLARTMLQYGVRPEIEIFDLSHIHAARRLADAGLIDDHPHIQFVMGVRNAMPADRRLLYIMVREALRLFPSATWTAAGIGVNQTPVMDWALEGGADGVRTGFEDNVRVSKHTLALSNAHLVEIACERIAAHDARPATVSEARLTLGLPVRHSASEMTAESNLINAGVG
jgi:uncharacterized protein (DUF849 family)